MIFSIRSGCRPAPEGPFERWRVSVDYGTANPTSMGLWGEKVGVWYRVEEYYYDSRREGPTADRCGIRRRTGASGGGSEHRAGHRGPVSGQLS